MKDAQKPNHISLNTMIMRIKEGRYRVPDFQRDFKWEPWDISDLMKSIFLDYYIGSLLLWKGKKENFETLSCTALYGVEERDDRDIVLDGQQRLTAIHYAFAAPNIQLPGRVNRAIYYIQVDRFMEEKYDEAFSYKFITSDMILDRMNDSEYQFSEHIFPLSIVGEGGKSLFKWFDSYEKYWEQKVEENEDEKSINLARKHAENARDFETHVSEIIGQYQISYIELDQEIEIDKICDIFTQINRKGIILDIFDLINALVRPQEIKLKSMWNEVKERLEFIDNKRMNIYILQVMSILRQAYCSPKYLYYLIPGHQRTVRISDKSEKITLISDKSDFEKQWNEAVSALEESIKVICHPQQYGVVSYKYLPYASILPVFSSLRFKVEELPPEQRLQAQHKIKKWYWASIFTKRYSGAVESTSARDFMDVQKWIEGDDYKPEPIRELESSFNTLDFKKEIQSGSSVYNGIFNLFVINGARDWVTGDVPQPDDLDNHHIIPVSQGKTNPDTNINTILNRSPLTSDTNRTIISDRLPNEYLPEWMRTNGEDTVREILHNHLISPTAFNILLRNPFSPDDFDEFIKERERTIKETIKNLIGLEAD